MTSLIDDLQKAKENRERIEAERSKRKVSITEAWLSSANRGTGFSPEGKIRKNMRKY